MRKTLLLTMILLSVSAWAAAQQETNSQSAPSSASQGTAQPSSASNSIEGCLGGFAGKFTLTDKAGTTYQLQLPQRADPSNLKQYIGANVRVKGTIANAAGSNPSAGGSSAGQASIMVTGMDKVSDTCSTKTPSANPKSQ